MRDVRNSLFGIHQQHARVLQAHLRDVIDDGHACIFVKCPAQRSAVIGQLIGDAIDRQIGILKISMNDLLCLAHNRLAISYKH